MVNRKQVQSLLKVVEDFVTGLREEDALQPTVGGSSVAFAEGRERANRASVVTPANQKIFKPTLGSKQQQQQQQQAEERKRKDGEGDGDGEKEGERQTQDSSINTAPVLRPPPLGHAALKEKEKAATEVGQRGEGQEKQNQPEQKKPKGPPRLVVKDSAKNNLSNNSKSVVVDPSSTRKEITDARHRLAQASNRRKSLEPPIGREEADRMAGLHRNLEGRKRPPGVAIAIATGAAGATHLGKPTAGRDNNDGIRGARQYLGSDDNQTESAGASIGSAAGNNVATQIGRSKPNVGGKRKKKSHTDDVFDFSTLPAHLQKSLAEIKQRKLDASAAKKKKPIDLTGLQRMKDRDGYDPRRLMH